MNETRSSTSTPTFAPDAPPPIGVPATADPPMAADTADVPAPPSRLRSVGEGVLWVLGITGGVLALIVGVQLIGLMIFIHALKVH